MLYLSQVLGAPVTDQNQARVGKVVDVLVAAEQVGSSAATYPSAILIEGEAELPLRVPLEAVERRDGLLYLRVPLSTLAEQPIAVHEQEVYLAHEVLDKQIINIERKKAVRVNDVCFDEDWCLLGIDSTTLGLVRRLTPAWLLGSKNRPVTFVPWEEIELISSQQLHPQEQSSQIDVAKRVQSGHLAELHPADIAEIVHQLTAGEGARLIERLDDETAANTMEEVDTERQLQILENIQSERAADILEAMGPDEVADLLAHMPEERAQELLHLMEPEESEDVQELLEYEPDTAGGLMTTDYITLNQSRTAQEALEAVRSNVQENDVRIAYIYCVSDETQEEQRVLGVVSLWDLLVAPPTQALAELMVTDVITVQADSEPHQVVEIMAKYNLLAVPVVDEGGILQGVVTVDDALDVLLPPERRRKPRRMY